MRDAWTLPRTAWGDPDLQGAWSFAAYTSLERPARYARRERLTTEEIAALDGETSTGPDRRRRPPPRESTPEQRAFALDASPYNAFWDESRRSTGRTALIVDVNDIFEHATRIRETARRYLDKATRSVRAWKGGLPYSRDEWLSVFPDGMRRLITPGI